MLTCLLKQNPAAFKGSWLHLPGRSAGKPKLWSMRTEGPLICYFMPPHKHNLLRFCGVTLQHHYIIKPVSGAATNGTVQSLYSQPAGCTQHPWTPRFSPTRTFLLHLQNGDSFTELVDDLPARMSYILWCCLLARRSRLHANVPWCTKR